MLRLVGILAFLLCALSPGVLSSHRPHFYSHGQDVFTTVQPRSENRLLNNTEPLHYSLELTTNIHNQVTLFSGTVNIRFRALDSINRVRVNSYLLTITSCTLYDASNAIIAGATCTTVDRFLDVTVATGLTSQAIYTLQVSYTGTHRAPSEGFHSSYYSVNGQTRYLASTQFQSVFAREAFPCFDEPFYRVPIKLTIRHDPSFHALGNAEIESTWAGVTVFKETWQLPSYLIAFVVSDFECTLKKGKQRICAQPNRMGEVGLAVEATDKILSWMETTFDEAYEAEKLDHIAIPTFQFGGMENWGLVVYHPWYLLFEDGVDTVNDKINVVSVIAHELAHMFYGNLITPKFWTYLWLSEGLATLYEFYGAHAAYPELRLDELYTVSSLQPAFRADSSGNSRPMTYYVDTVAGIEGIFDTIAYLKAGSVFRMIKYGLGEATFHKAMIKYLNVNKNSGVDEKPLYEALEAAIAEDRTAPPGIIASVMDTWSLQGGFPLVTVDRDYTTNQIHISQLEFIAQSAPVTSTKLWSIPISFTQKTGANFIKDTANFWFQVREQDVASSVAANDWVIFNIHQSGYYRVNYDDRNWQQLITELVMGNHEVFPPTNRAQMIDDINWLADYGKVSNTLRLSLMEYLARETDMIPLEASRRHVLALNQMFAGSPKYPLFKKYVQKMVEKSFRSVEKFFFVDEDINTLKSRSVLIDLACSVGMDECQALTRTLLFTELKTKSVLINKEDRENVYCHGLKTASKKMFELFMKSYDELYQATPAAAEKGEPFEGSMEDNYHDYSNIYRMNRVIGCYGDKEGIEELLMNLFSAERSYYPKYRLQILRSIVKNGHAGQVVDFLLENVHEFKDLHVNEAEQSTLTSILVEMSFQIYSEEYASKFTEWLKVLTDAEVEIHWQIPENLAHNLDWFERHGSDLEVFLVERYFDDCESELPSSAVSYSWSIGALLVAALVKMIL